MKHTKDGKNLNALLRRAMLGVLDIMLFALANCSICYLTMNGHIMATDYKYMIFNYLHFGLTSVGGDQFRLRSVPQRMVLCRIRRDCEEFFRCLGQCRTVVLM